ncbi:Intradiol ring-cleavage dioxygenase, partial [Halenospora varia]
IARRHALAAESAKTYSSCASRVQTRDVTARRDAKTQSFVNNYLSGRGLEPNFDKRVESATTCVLVPEEVEGPYYVSGELIRNDIREKEAGIDLLLDVQLLNVHTCQPLPNVLVDFWACNSTGVYSGVAAQNTVATKGLTFLRGLAMSDKDGIVQILTKVPGWYTGRAQHIHVKAHVNYTVSDGLLKGGAVVHTGQLYMNQSILSEINVLPAYAADLNPFTPNAQDFIFTGEANATAGYDPYIHVTRTGKTLSDGLLGKITLALD